MYIGIGTVVLIVIIVLVVLMLRRRLYSAAAPARSTCWPSRLRDDRWEMPGQPDMHLVQPRRQLPSRAAAVRARRSERARPTSSQQTE